MLFVQKEFHLLFYSVFIESIAIDATIIATTPRINSTPKTASAIVSRAPVIKFQSGHDRKQHCLSPSKDKSLLQVSSSTNKAF